MRLRRSTPEDAGFHRRRRGRGFSYVDEDGRRISDAATLERIRALVIPPAWADVWICADERGHLQAIGTDDAGRRQYRYHDAWRDQRDRAKFAHIERFAERLPDVREQVSRDLRRRGLPRERVLACSVRLLERGLFRIGSEDYAEANGSFGLATLRKEHVTVHRDRPSSTSSERRANGTSGTSRIRASYRSSERCGVGTKVRNSSPTAMARRGGTCVRRISTPT